MEFESVKSDFKTYLNDKSKDDSSARKYGENDDVSIFDKSDDFKEFIKDKHYEHKETQGSTSGKNVIKIKVDYSDGSGVSAADMINEIMKEDAVKKVLDKDGNGLSAEEIQAFTDTISGADGKDGSVSMNDVFSGIDAIKNGTYAEKTTENSAVVKTDEAITMNTANIASSGASNITATEFATKLPTALAAKLDEKNGTGFSAKLERIAASINCDPRDLVGLMQNESTINSKAYNPKGGATGLIQFMPATAAELGTSTSALANMSAIDQLDYVEKFFNMVKPWGGFSKNAQLSAGDLYALTFLPGVADNETLAVSGGKLGWAYNANSGLDWNGDGTISKTDLSNIVHNKYNEVMNQYGLA